MRTSAKKQGSKTHYSKSTRVIKLSSVDKREYGRRISTNIVELDRVLGGGIVPGMVTLIAGEPGIGKSTLVLQIAKNVPNVFYIAGEESAAQVANRAARLGIKGDNIIVFEETDVDKILQNLDLKIKSRKKNSNRSSKFPSDNSLVIVDSIQTLTTEDFSGNAGSIGQVRECASRLASFAKQTGIPAILIGHVTKEGAIAGPRVLEHMVDTVLWFEGDRRDILRLLRAVKNRFGTTDEVGIFSMESDGLEQVTDASKIFLRNEQKALPGSSVTVALEGTRPLLVEIQALVNRTKLAFPRRVVSGVDTKRLELIVAVLSKRGGIPLWEYDVFVNVAGGIRINDPGVDLAIALSVASSFFSKELPKRAVAIGEIGLLGEIRDVARLEKRVKEASRLGFDFIIGPKQSNNIRDAVQKYFAR